MKYFITFIEYFTRKAYVYFMKDKLNVLDIFEGFKRNAENEIDHKMKIIRTDNGKEYCNSNFETFLANCGITHQNNTSYISD